MSLVLSLLIAWSCLAQKTEPKPLSSPEPVRIAEGQYGGMGQDEAGHVKAITADNWVLYQLSDSSYRVEIKKPIQQAPQREIDIQLKLDAKFRLADSSVHLLSAGSETTSLHCDFGKTNLNCSSYNESEKKSERASAKTGEHYALLPDEVGAAVDVIWFQALLASQTERVTGATTAVQLFTLGEGSELSLVSDPAGTIHISYAGKD